jgi:hypothetical protein
MEKANLKEGLIRIREKCGMWDVGCGMYNVRCMMQNQQ